MAAASTITTNTNTGPADPAPYIAAAATEPYLLVLGFGFVASELVRVAAASDTATGTKKPWRHVLVIVRSANHSTAVRTAGGIPIVANLLDAATATAPYRAVIAHAAYLAQTAQPTAYDRAYRANRIKLESNVLSCIEPKSNRLKRIVFVSGSSYFGKTTRGGPAVTETHHPRESPTASRVLDECTTQIEAFAADFPPPASFNYAIAYVGAVYGRGSWFTEHIINTLASNQPVSIVKPAPVWPFMHVTDVARAIEFLLMQTKPDAPGPAPVSQAGSAVAAADTKTKAAPAATTGLLQRLNPFKSSAKPAAPATPATATTITAAGTGSIGPPTVEHSNRYYIISNSLNRSLSDYIVLVAHAIGIPSQYDDKIIEYYNPPTGDNKAGGSGSGSSGGGAGAAAPAPPLLNELSLNFNHSGAKLIALGFKPLYPTLEAGVLQVFPPPKQQPSTTSDTKIRSKL